MVKSTTTVIMAALIVGLFSCRPPATRPKLSGSMFEYQQDAVVVAFSCSKYDGLLIFILDGGAAEGCTSTETDRNTVISSVITTTNGKYRLRWSSNEPAFMRSDTETYSLQGVRVVHLGFDSQLREQSVTELELREADVLGSDSDHIEMKAILNLPAVRRALSLVSK